MYAALMTDFVQNCKKCLRELLTGGESELANVRIRTKEGTEILALPAGEYTLIVIQNCTGKPWNWGDEEAGGAPAGGGGSHWRRRSGRAVVVDLRSGKVPPEVVGVIG